MAIKIRIAPVVNWTSRPPAKWQIPSSNLGGGTPVSTKRNYIRLISVCQIVS
jgi:hypothetical protein